MRSGSTLTTRNPSGMTPTISVARDSIVMPASDDGAIAAESPPPIAVAEHHDARCPRHLVGWRQPASEHRLDAERRERAV